MGVEDGVFPKVQTLPPTRRLSRRRLSQLASRLELRPPLSIAEHHRQHPPYFAVANPFRPVLACQGAAVRGREGGPMHVFAYPCWPNGLLSLPAIAIHVLCLPHAQRARIAGMMGGEAS